MPWSDAMTKATQKVNSISDLSSMMDLKVPTLLLDEAKCRKNIQLIVEKAKRAKVEFRPHFKTHQSHEIGRWYRALGVTKITVSSLTMAEYFAADGWSDITVAFPLNVHEIETINRLAEKIVLNLLVVSPETVQWLSSALQFPVNIFIEVDNGYHRTGVSPDDFIAIEKILDDIGKNPLLHFSGFLSHAGHSYKAKSRDEISTIHRDSIACMLPLKEKFARKFPSMILSTGDTPTCSVADNFSGIDEIRPGNLVFYDLTQTKIGSCTIDQIAVAMACPIVALYPSRNEIVIYGGAVHFSKDYLISNQNSMHYGQVVSLMQNGWDTSNTGMYLKSLSQEHGIIHAPAHAFRDLRIGAFVGVLPVHSCLTADLAESYRTPEGKKISRL